MYPIHHALKRQFEKYTNADAVLAYNSLSGSAMDFVWWQRRFSHETFFAAKWERRAEKP